MLENPNESAVVGPTFSCLIREQFKRTRSGDRFFYRNLFSNEKLIEIQKSSLAELICLNTNIDQITPDVFLLSKYQKFIHCNDVPRSDLKPWIEKDKSVGCN